ncbi:uncharacterized protein LOC135839042 [Planococcus citri]|uniref:uncharacterized protein LOC135839042 n=1 Tax=Planococcus citri TaxID=170843 RepID=UPI0031F8CA3A
MKSCAVKLLLTCIFLAFNGNLNPIILATAAQTHDTFSSLCQDQMVKLGSNIYHLDRLTASLNSDYFERVFTSDDFKQKNDSILEIKSIENDEVFPTILDILHKKKYLNDVLNKDNYLSLLKAMNYFGMEIDLKSFESFIEGDLKIYSPQDAKIFELYDFIKQNEEFEYLLRGLFKCLSQQLDTEQNKNEKTPSSDKPLDHLMQLIGELECLNEKTRCHFVPLCAILLKRAPKIFENSNSGSECDSDNLNDEESERNTIVNSRNNPEKPRAFRKNGDFCDITVRIKNTTIKLHRPVLESVSGYFKEIFRAEYSEAIATHNGTLKCPRIDKEYVLSDIINPTDFDVVFRYLYYYYPSYTLQKEDCKWYKISQTFIISHILKIDLLSSACEFRLKKEPQCVKSEEVAQILDFTYGNPEYEDIYVMFMVKNLNESWPKINMSQFCSVNWTLLEKILNAPHFLEYDPNKIVEICSKWTSHDARNRYQFLPKIARIINPSCVVNDEEYTTDDAEGLNNQSQQLFQAELWKILSSLPYTICSEKVKKNTSRKLEEIPVFIATVGERPAAILNSDLEVITSFNNSLEQYSLSFLKKKDPIISATLIDNNLFIIYNLFLLRFQVYNFLLKKCFELHSNLPNLDSIYSFVYNRDYYILLNCNDEIYACSKKFDQVAKYSMQFNLWTVLSKQESYYYKEIIHYTSDGKMLYRTYKVSKEDQPSAYIVETFDFENNLWTPLSGLPSIETGFQNVYQLSVVSDRNFIVLSSSNIIISDRDSMRKEWHWKFHQIPLEILGKVKEPFTVAQCEDRLLLLMDDALYSFYPSNGSIELKKKFPKLAYHSIVAIDRRLDVGSKKNNNFLS